MDPNVAEKILDAQDAAMKDAYYQQLLDEHDVLKKRFNAALDSMSQDQRDVVTEYLGLAFAMHLRLLELACSQ
jgi:hypothetical protein